MTCPRDLRWPRPVPNWRWAAVGTALVGVLTTGCTVEDGSAAGGSTALAGAATSGASPQAETSSHARVQHEGSAIRALIRAQERAARGGNGSGDGDGSDGTGALIVRRSAHSVAVASTAADARRLSLLLRYARRALSEVTGPPRTVLLAYWPKSRASFDSLISAAPGSYDSIAAVTTRLDRGNGGSPIVVVVNPDVFATLSPLGRRVVIAHESAHAVTDDGAAEMPGWLAEGFADYVGIRAVPAAVHRSLRAAAHGVRRDGLPSHLPSGGAFATSAPHLNATYAQSWLAVRLLARRYGDMRLVRFYDAVATEPDGVGVALGDELGITVRAITRAWRARLRGLADAGRADGGRADGG